MSTDRGLLSLDPCIHRGWLFACTLFGLVIIDNQSSFHALSVGTFASEDAHVAADETDSLFHIFVVGGRLGIEGSFSKSSFLKSVGFRISGELVGNVNPITIPVDERAGWTTPRMMGGVEVGLYVFEDHR